MSTEIHYLEGRGGELLTLAELDQLDELQPEELVSPLGRVRSIRGFLEPGYQILLGGDRHGWLACAVTPQPGLLRQLRAGPPPDCETCAGWAERLSALPAPKFSQLAAVIASFDECPPVIIAGLPDPLPAPVAGPGPAAEDGPPVTWLPVGPGAEGLSVYTDAPPPPGPPPDDAQIEALGVAAGMQPGWKTGAGL